MPSDWLLYPSLDAFQSALLIHNGLASRELSSLLNIEATG
jgi:hypothetical protein